MKCRILYGGLRGSILFLKIFIWILGRVKGRVEISHCITVLKIVVWVRVLFICM